LLSKEVQIHLLDKLLHRDLSNSQHLTNIHLFHEMRYPADNSAVTDGLDVRSTSFFATNSDTLLQPKDAEMHKPMNIAQLLRKKLRWITLGGQYDWTNKVYPPEEPPQFPPDIASLLAAYFPTISAQAAIVNLYTPGDTLSVHRDVSEECERDLVSISIGCDALFLVGTMDGSDSTVVRLRSGDAVLMSGASRFSWHGVPKVIAETCPNGLADWPCSDVTDSSLECWRGWLRSKRINLNVRQMRETSLDRAVAT
jgi:DNA alkylation damage repair protein AlkB